MIIFWFWNQIFSFYIEINIKYLYFLQSCAILCLLCFLGKNSNLLPLPSRIIYWALLLLMRKVKKWLNFFIFFPFPDQYVKAGYCYWGCNQRKSVISSRKLLFSVLDNQTVQGEQNSHLNPIPLCPQRAKTSILTGKDTLGFLFCYFPVNYNWILKVNIDSWWELPFFFLFFFAALIHGAEWLFSGPFIYSFFFHLPTSQSF